MGDFSYHSHCRIGMLEIQSHMAGQVIGGRYEVQEAPIGQGGMGVVYKAYDNITKRFVALKTMWGALDPAAVELFEKEWTVLARLSHPNIVDILDTGEFVDNGQRKPYFVMPLLPGNTLDKLIKTASQRLTVERTVEIMSQACRGLQAAHDQGLVHRDLKPSNIFVMDDDTVKIIDFGVVHLTDARTVTGMKGTLQYMAPEQLEMKPATALSDIFSLGVVCYETLTGRKPFARKSEAEVVEAIRLHVPPPASDINASVNQLISRTVHKAIAKQPYHRFSNAREFADTLQRALRNEHIERFDRSKIQPRIDRIKRAYGEGDYQFAMEILTELESEGHIDPEMSLLRMQIEQAIKVKNIRQLLESARTRMEEEEYPLALQKVQSVLEIDPTNVDALAIKSQIERQRSEKQIDNWFRLAHQHLDNQLFSQARSAGEEVLKIDKNNARARAFIAEVDQREQDLQKIRDEKQKLYESALTSYRNGEISTALSKLERVLDLSRSISKGNPQTDAQYQVLYNQIRSERDELHSAYGEGRRNLEDRNFQKALEICNSALSRRPGDPMFQALKLEVEEAQRQQQSANIAEINSRVEGEADLDRKLNILKEAAEKYPKEPLFAQSLKLIKDRRDLVNSIVTRARHYEEQGQFNDAIGQWDILRNIYGQYPGLDFELERLNRRKQESVREEAKAKWVDKIDRLMATGDYPRAGQTAQEALAEFASDAELLRLQHVAEQSQKKAEDARVLLEEGQRLGVAKRHLEGIEKLREALRLDEKSPIIRSALLSALLERARGLVGQDWRAALPFVDEALQIDESDPVARSLSSLIEDYKRRQVVDKYLTEARDLQASGNLDAALKKIEQGMAEHPNEIRLSQLYGTLRSAIEAKRSETKRPTSSGVQPPPAPRPAAPPPPPTPPTPSVPSSARPASPPPSRPVPGTEPAPVPMETIVQPSATRRGAVPPVAATPPPQAAKPPVVPPPPPQPPKPAPSANDGKKKGPKQEVKKAAADLASTQKLPVAPVPAPPGKKKAPLAIIGAVAAVVVIVAGILATKLLHHPSSQTPAAAGDIAVQLIANVAGTKFTVDGQPVAGDSVKLAPGSHRAEAEADGYRTDTQSFTVTSNSAAPVKVQFNLVAALPQLRIASDIKTGKVVIDDKDTSDLQDGNFVKDGLGTGDHTLKILDNGKLVMSFAFRIEPQSIVSVTGPLQSPNAPGIVVSSLGSNAVVYASGGLKGNLANQPAQPIPTGGLKLTNVTPGNNELVVTDGKNERRIGIDTSAVAVVSVQLGAARDAGSLLVQSNVPDAQVMIDGVLLKRPLANGARFFSLPPKVYQIKLQKDGYQDAPAQQVEIKKGEQQTLKFSLTPIPQKAVFAFDGMPPDAEILIDGKHAGVATAAGTFSTEVAPGQHSIVVRKQGYDDLTVTKDAQSGTVKIAAALSAAKAVTGSIVFHVTPATAKISFHREGENVAHDATNGQTVSVKPGSYEVSAVADGYYQKTTTIPVTAGKSSTADLTLNVQSTGGGEKTASSVFEDGANWGIDGGWWYHKTPGYSWLRRNEGNFIFTVLRPGKKGIFAKAKRVEWTVDYQDSNRIEYSLDDKQLRRRVYSTSGAEPEDKSGVNFGSGNYYTLQIFIDREHVQVKINGSVIDDVKRANPGTPLGKFGFRGEVQLLPR